MEKTPALGCTPACCVESLDLDVKQTEVNEDLDVRTDRGERGLGCQNRPR